MRRKSYPLCLKMQQSHKRASYTVNGVTEKTVQSSLAGLGRQGGDLFSQRADSAAEGALPQHPRWRRTASLWRRRAYRLQGGKWRQACTVAGPQPQATALPRAKHTTLYHLPGSPWDTDTQFVTVRLPVTTKGCSR